MKYRDEKENYLDDILHPTGKFSITFPWKQIADSNCIFLRMQPQRENLVSEGQEVYSNRAAREVLKDQTLHVRLISNTLQTSKKKLKKEGIASASSL